jgi:hypothetical protein
MIRTVKNVSPNETSAYHIARPVGARNRFIAEIINPLTISPLLSTKKLSGKHPLPAPNKILPVTNNDDIFINLFMNNSLKVNGH